METRRNLPVYKIVRKYKDWNHRSHNKVIRTDLTLAEAMAHCKSPDSKKKDVWFDGYTKQ